VPRMLPRALALSLLLTFAASNAAHATQVGHGRDFGLGVTLGAPSGLSLEFFLNPKHAINVAVGSGFYGGHALQVHVDYQWYVAKLTQTSAFELPLYIGLGGRFNFWYSESDHHYWGGDKHNGRIGAGLRVPIGIDFQLNKVPLDIFVEVVPGLGVFPGVGVFVDGAVGVRYYF
jgi:hypothetical protein